MKILKGFLLAFNMLTIFPFFKIHNFFKGINGYSVMFYPLVGFILGLLLWLIHTLLSPYLPAFHLNIIIFSLLVVFSGGLHLDGFSDSVDGLFVDKKRAIAVMKDSNVGGMGMVFTTIFLILKASTFVVFELFYLLPFILMLSRLNGSLAIYFYPYISKGITSLTKEEFTKTKLLVMLSFVTASLLFFNHFNLFLVSILTLVICASSFKKRLGGLSGDIYGFIIEVSELVLLNYVIVVTY